MIDEMSPRHPTTWMSSHGVLARTNLSSYRLLFEMSCRCEMHGGRKQLQLAVWLSSRRSKAN
jgi:hypothetical protein